MRQAANSDATGNVSNETLINHWMRKVPGLSPGKTIPLMLKEPNAGLYSVAQPDDPSTPLNAAHYSNYGAIPDDAVGRTIFRFGWNSPSKWIALTDREEVIPLTDPYSGRSYRWSEAIPFELVLLGWWNNPNWNPYGIQWQERSAITGNGATADTAYSGWNEDHRGYLLPIGVFDAAGIQADSADTGAGFKWVMCADGIPRKFVAAGIRVFTLPVGGKRRRTRYPIMPIAHHGNPVYHWQRAERLRRERESWAIGAAIIEQTLATDDLQGQLDNKLSRLEQKMTGQLSGLRTYVDDLHADNEQQDALLAANDINLILDTTP